MSLCKVAKSVLSWLRPLGTPLMTVPSDTSKPYQVVESFSFDQLCQALSSTKCGPAQVKGNKRVAYLDRYLRDIVATTLVVEDDYIDGDFLDDFASYYVKCFSHYESRCKRLHFFAESFTEDELRDLIRGTLNADRHKIIAASYRGFVVARPLPQAILGRTVLATYSEDKPGGKRIYPCVFPCTANLFGEPLSIQSLPYQEQDNVLAKCATVALWSSFKKAAHLFGTHAPRPTSIAASANRAVVRRRPFPSRGLIVEQMCSAILGVGLEPEVIRYQKDVPLISLLYGYLKAGLPAILGITVEDRGDHAIALAGFSLRNSSIHEREATKSDKLIPMIGLRIDEFYAHDDQIGPFAHIKIERGDEEHPIVFKGSWKNNKGEPATLLPTVVIVPVYNKIRLSFTDIHAWAWRFHRAFAKNFRPEVKLEWDIHLTSTNEYKATIRKENASPDVLEQMRARQHPRFIWRVRLHVNGKMALEMLGDATDISHSFPIYGLVWSHMPLMERVIQTINDSELRKSLTQTLTEPFLAFLESSAGKNIFLRPKVPHRNVY